MTLFLIFAITLVIAVLISEIAEKSVLSVSVLFLGAGFMAGRHLFGDLPPLPPDLLRRIAELALFSILFTDGMRTRGLKTVSDSWRHLGRALLLGMPLTIAGIGLLWVGLLHMVFAMKSFGLCVTICSLVAISSRATGNRMLEQTAALRRKFQTGPEPTILSGCTITT